MNTTVDQEKYRQVLGPRLGPIYHGLFIEETWLTAKWLEYKKLFAVSPERIDLLNGTSSFFFGVVQEVLWNDILLHLTRITDPPKSAGKQNLSIQQLLLAISDR
ncbi:MAG: hypothetical protein IBX69_18590, partial [Anaerolineales bacterium]|nr:hypothetical protein [Anaerolineales bacterium]